MTEYQFQVSVVPGSKLVKWLPIYNLCGHPGAWARSSQFNESRPILYLPGSIKQDYFIKRQETSLFDFVIDKFGEILYFNIFCMRIEFFIACYAFGYHHFGACILGLG